MQPGMRCAHLIVRGPDGMEDRGARTHFICYACPDRDGPYPFSLPYEETL